MSLKRKLRNGSDILLLVGGIGISAGLYGFNYYLYQIPEKPDELKKADRIEQQLSEDIKLKKAPYVSDLSTRLQGEYNAVTSQDGFHDLRREYNKEARKSIIGALGSFTLALLFGIPLTEGWWRKDDERRSHKPNYCT